VEIILTSTLFQFPKTKKSEASIQAFRLTAKRTSWEIKQANLEGGRKYQLARRNQPAYNNWHY